MIICGDAIEEMRKMDDKAENYINYLLPTAHQCPARDWVCVDFECEESYTKDSLPELCSAKVNAVKPLLMPDDNPKLNVCHIDMSLNAVNIFREVKFS